MQISQKQSLIPEAIRNGSYRHIILIGAIGTSKTYGAAVAILSVAIKYPGCLIPVARKNMTELKRGTLYSFREAADDMGYDRYTENQQSNTWTLHNGSVLMFLELDHTKDRQFSKIKSINATCAMIDEADGVVAEGYRMLFSRTGRKNKNGAPRFIIATCNPNEAWVKTDVYDPWKAGALAADTTVIEFDTRDSFLGDDYYQPFETMPLPWRKRYLLNDWSYSDDDNSLFKYRHMDRIGTTSITPALRYSGMDVARTGRDRSVIAQWEGSCLVDIKIVKDTDEQKDTAEQAEVLIAYNQDNTVGFERSTVDGIGVGVGVIDHCRKEGHRVGEFIAGGKPRSEKYNNVRSEAAFLLAKDIEDSKVSFHEGCPFLSEFKKEATMHNYEIRDKQMILESKDKVKERLGHSPDLFDAVVMAYWHQKRRQATSDVEISVGADYDDLYKDNLMVL